ncbi:MAG: coproporphyrinogen-III oxidase family protein [Candidatus Bathyarchaeia archaeon]
MLLDQYAFGALGKRIVKVFSAIFRREDEVKYRECISKSFSKNSVGVYIHFPFCKSLCPACPYVRDLWQEKMVRAYVSALKMEIRLVGGVLKDLGLKVVDIHAGGGTPSLIDKEWKEVIQTIGECFDVSSDCRFGIEANPDDLTEDKAFQLRESGVDEISIGVQSLFKTNLRMLGRRHGVEESLEAVEKCRDAGFKLINVDMMYMLPEQSTDLWIHDLKLASELGADQITCYPLLVPHYTPFYKMIKEGRVQEQPNMKEFKRMYYAAVHTLTDEGYTPLRYYSFGRKGEEYSTVELEMVGPLLGFGSGAISFTGGYEYVNTCSVKEYIKSVERGRLPIAGGRNVAKEERAVRYVAERLSALKLKIKDFEREFEEPFEALMKKSGYNAAIRMGLLFGNLKREGDEIRVTEKGMWQRNLSGWAFVLSIPCRIVEEYTKTPWPIEVKVP